MMSDENEGKSAGKRVGALLTQQASSSRRTGAAFTLGDSSYKSEGSKAGSVHAGACRKADESPRVNAASVRLLLLTC